MCSVQRSGSWLLSHALEDTGVLGCPAEYFHRGDEPFWRGRWGAADEDAFLRAVRDKPVTGNGVWAAKMMHNYLADAAARLRAWPRLGLAPDVTDRAVLEAAFPGLRYVWLRRQDKVRQAISWCRADVTDQYGLPAGAAPPLPPAFDRGAIAGLVRYAEAGEAGWRDWFAAHSLEPFEIAYEDLVTDLDAAVRAIAGFLDVPLPPGLGHIRPRGHRQADHHTDRFVRMFNRHDVVDQIGHPIGGQPDPGMRPGVRHDDRPHPAAEPGNAAEKLLVPRPPRRDIGSQPAQRRRADAQTRPDMLLPPVVFAHRTHQDGLIAPAEHRRQHLLGRDPQPRSPRLGEARPAAGLQDAAQVNKNRPHPGEDTIVGIVPARHMPRERVRPRWMTGKSELAEAVAAGKQESCEEINGIGCAPAGTLSAGAGGSPRGGNRGGSTHPSGLGQREIQVRGRRRLA